MFIAMFMEMSTPSRDTKPRPLRAVNPPLGSYFRVGRDRHPLQALISEKRADFTGLVFDPWDHERQVELRDGAGHLETVLDTRTFELSTLRGSEDARLAGLPWAGPALPHGPSNLTGAGGELLAGLIADDVAKRRYTAVLAPTHLLRDVTDEWLGVDFHVTRVLRRALDERGLSSVTIYYPLTLHSKVFYSATARAEIMTRLAEVEIDALWLRMHPFGAHAGALALRRYIEAARDLHRLELPIVGEHTGTVGVALLAFGAVGGIESGITFGERFDVGPLYRPPQPDQKPFAPPPRVYIHDLGEFLTRKQMAELFAKPGMRSAFGCRDSNCCTRGPTDTARDPRRHFLLQRQREVNEISRRPEPVRPSMYLEGFLRPASDKVLRATKVEPSFEGARKRLEQRRLMLGEMNKSGPPPTVAKAPEGKRTHPHLQRTA